LRSDELCQSVRGCPSADTVTCRDCLIARIPEDIRAPGACPSCQSPRYQRERCHECELERLNLAIASSAAGQLLMRALLIADALAMRMHVTLDDVTPEEFKALTLLHMERNRKQDEDMKKSQQQARRPMAHATTWRQ
jgi:hypothetical protein